MEMLLYVFGAHIRLIRAIYDRISTILTLTHTQGFFPSLLSSSEVWIIDRNTSISEKQAICTFVVFLPKCFYVTTYGSTSMFYVLKVVGSLGACFPFYTTRCNPTHRSSSIHEAQKCSLLKHDMAYALSKIPLYICNKMLYTKRFNYSWL